METAPYSPKAADESPTAVLGRLTRALGTSYQVRGLVGRGGFAEVYEVWDTNLERRLAVKVLDPSIAWTPGTLDRFRHEARTVARLTHPAILPIHFVGDAEGIAYYVMPFVEGESVRDLLDRRGSLNAEETANVATPVLQALAHAHEIGLIHRDIKPDNVMIEESTGRTLLVDFGIAKALDSEKASQMTQTGLAVGTPHFMSPEQAMADKLDGRSDLYSFGAMLFEMVTGEKPFDGDTAQGIIAQHLADPVREPSEVNPTVPDWLSDVVVRLMEKRPADRFQDATEVLQAIQEQIGPAPNGKPSKVKEDLGVGEILRGSDWAGDMEKTLQPTGFPSRPKPETDPAPEEGGPAPTVAEDGADGGVKEAERPPSPVAKPPVAEEVGPVVDGYIEVTAEALRPPPSAAPPPQEAPPEAPPRVSGTPPASPPPNAPPVSRAPPVVGHKPLTSPGQGEQSAAEIAAKAFADAAIHERRLKRAERAYSLNRRVRRFLIVAVLIVGGGGALLAASGNARGAQGMWDNLRTKVGALLGGGFGRTVAGERYHYITNSLVEPVELLVKGDVDRTLGPGQRDSMPLTADNASMVSWRLVRPSRRDGRAMGRQFSAVLAGGVESNGNRHSSIVGISAGRSMFAPLITNPTNLPVAVLINAGTRWETRCNCVVPAGTRDMHIGYYPLLENSTVRFFSARTPYRGRYVERRNFGTSVDRLSGSVALNVGR
jgi:serine/threonine protein kinase